MSKTNSNARSNLKAPRIICELEDEHAGDYAGKLVTIPPDQAHHIVNVLRLAPGAAIEIISRNSHRKYSAEIESTAGSVQVLIKSQSLSIAARSRVSTLLFAVCKGDRNDFVAEKACELGVEKVIFWQADHSVVKIKNAEEAGKKTSRWNKICEAAAKQCGNPRITQAVFQPSLQKSIELISADEQKGDLKFSCSLSAQAKELKDMGTAPADSHIVIGPEGDFSSAEADLLKSSNFLELSLGPNTLRAETAAVVAISAVNSLWGFEELA